METENLEVEAEAEVEETDSKPTSAVPRRKIQDFFDNEYLNCQVRR